MQEITTVGDLLKRHGAEIFGTLGALIGLSFIEKLTLFAAFLALIAGFAFAVVGAPIVTHYIDPAQHIRDNVTAGAALVLGISGFVIAGAVHATASNMRTWLPGFLRRFVERKTGE